MRHLNHLSMIVVTVLTLAGCGQNQATDATSALASSGGRPATCQTQGPVTLCDVRSDGTLFNVSYTGYLGEGARLGECRPDFVRDSNLRVGLIVNGYSESPVALTTGCTTATTFSASIGATHRGSQLEVYIVDDQGRYDSQYGANYRFNF